MSDSIWCIVSLVFGTTMGIHGALYNRVSVITETLLLTTQLSDQTFLGCASVCERLPVCAAFDFPVSTQIGVCALYHHNSTILPLPDKSYLTSTVFLKTLPATFCCDVVRLFGTSTYPTGIYSLRITYGQFAETRSFCSIDSGGWLVIFRKMDNLVDFDRTWAEYKRGFGQLNGSFWYGNDALHAVTAEKSQQLRILLYYPTGLVETYLFDNFVVSGEDDKYRMNAVFRSGRFTQILAYSTGRQFSTKDEDHDVWPGSSCSHERGFGFWFGWCSYFNPAGILQTTFNQKAQFLDGTLLVGVEMSLRPMKVC